jgi:two-component system, sensor histidine kinase PdtaS
MVGLIFEAAPSAMIMVGDDGRIALVNSQTEKLFGYDRSELQGQPVEMLVPERFRHVHRGHRGTFLNAPTARAMGAGRDLFGVRKDGSEVPIEIGLNPISSADGNFVVASIIDITERKTAENKVKRLLAEKAALLQEVHHRVKNNMQMVCSLLSLQANSVEDQEATTQLKACERRVMSMAMIHEQLYSHQHMAFIDLAEYGRHLVTHLFFSYSLNKSVTYRLELAETRLTIDQAIPCGLILSELITNAFKYGYPGGEGEILIHISSDGNRVRMSVSDQGVGLPPDFERKTSESLGMTLIRMLTKQLGGHLEIGKQPGASFSVRFTIATEHAAASTACA